MPLNSSWITLSRNPMITPKRDDFVKGWLWRFRFLDVVWDSPILKYNANIKVHTSVTQHQMVHTTEKILRTLWRKIFYPRIECLSRCTTSSPWAQQGLFILWRRLIPGVVMLLASGSFFSNKSIGYLERNVGWRRCSKNVSPKQAQMESCRPAACVPFIDVRCQKCVDFTCVWIGHLPSVDPRFGDFLVRKTPRLAFCHFSSRCYF